MIFKKIKKVELLEHEKEVLKNNNIQLTHLYLSIKAENRELRKRIEYLSKSKDKNGGFVNISIPDSTKKVVKELREQGLSYRQIAKKTNISATSVGKIINEKL